MIVRAAQFGHALGELLLQRGDAHPDVDAGAQLVEIDRLGHVVIGAGVETGDEIGAAIARRQQQDVQTIEARRRPHAPAQFDSIELGHRPIDDRE